MADVTKCVLLLIAIVVCGQGLAVRLDISPNQIMSLMPRSVHMSCVPDDSTFQQVKYVMMMKLLGPGQTPIAVLARGSHAPYVIRNSSDLEVQGHIDKIIASESYLNLTMFEPKEGDAGLYQCVMYYADESYFLKERSDEANLTYDKPDVQSVTEYFQKKITELDLKLEERTKKLAVAEMGSPNKVSMLEPKKENYSSNDGYISAFSAKSTLKGSTSIGDTVVFDDVIMKEGQGYDATSGLFTAPRTGIYGFQLTAMMRSRQASFDLDLNLNDNPVASLSAGSDKYSDQSSISILLKLQTGDVVKVTVRYKSRSEVMLQPNTFTFFSGYLLREIH